MVFPVPGGFVDLYIVTHALSLDFVPISFLWRALWESAIVLGSGSYPRSKQIMAQENQNRDSENVHYAASEEDCRRMEVRQGWRLKRTERVGNGILSTQCVFDGEQTSFDSESKD